MVAQAGGADRIAGIGITNQRETVVFWDKQAPASRWPPRSSGRIAAPPTSVPRRCATRDEALVQARTGLLLDPYFSGVQDRLGATTTGPNCAAAGDRLAIGTIDAWLIWKLTARDGRSGLHVTDATNASRTALMTLAGGWDDELCDLFGAPRDALPDIVDSAGRFGETRAFGGVIPITGIAGDQQSASIGQACLATGDTKATYGTGAFILTHAGIDPPTSDHRLLSTVAWQMGGKRTYALEGSVFVAGSLIQWLRDSLGLIATAAETEELARSVEDSAGVYLVPALSGLGAPWWQPDVRASLTGLSFTSGKAHVARAALEAMAYQTHDLKTAFAADAQDWRSLKIDGGMVANDWMAQDLADVLGLPVERPTFTETTALGPRCWPESARACSPTSPRHRRSAVPSKRSNPA